jgi:hypothetical protein
MEAVMAGGVYTEKILQEHFRNMTPTRFTS